MDDCNICLENVFEENKSQTIAKETGQETDIIQGRGHEGLNSSGNRNSQTGNETRSIKSKKLKS